MIRSAITYCKTSLLILMISLCFFGNDVYSQEDKKDISLSVQYVKIMKENSFLKISAKYKGKDGFEPCANLNFIVSKIDTNDVEAAIKIGLIKTNKEGKAKFIIPLKHITPSASFSVILENDKNFEDAEEIVTITNVNIETSVEKIDSVYNIKARLVSNTDEPIAEESLKVGLKRLFGNLGIGEEESYATDEDGVILVPIEKGLTGINGKLNFQVALEESDTYGTVIDNVTVDFGVPIVDESSFNERTMWSPPTKTPIFLWIIPNILLIGIWSILLLLVLNLFKIYKSKK
ncbi:hypothetical protein [Flavobacterium sp.]|uniref:hypothetical protein n=1 Tax=Flavobacterium sp. TaxID=239 RepID=UPI002B4AFD50|nr:hypothetical protein [Flavobacterium sp.]HLF51329.1 hypothetical protein [Flavobacterium sp.]